MNGLSLLSFFDLSSILIIFFLIPIAGIILWLLFRELLTWYLKVNQIISILTEISNNLKILTADKHIEQLGQEIPAIKPISSNDLNKTTSQ